MRVRSIQGDTVDMLCQRHLGQTAVVTEQTLDLNPGLAALGPILPNGTQVNLPDVAPAKTTPLTQLWD
jgi:phage tail protein X